MFHIVKLLLIQVSLCIYVRLTTEPLIDLDIELNIHVFIIKVFISFMSEKGFEQILCQN